MKTRDDLAFGRIMARHARAVRRVAYGYVHDSHAAEDVSQAAFLVLAKRPRPALRSARRRGTLLPWLATVARHASANWYRADRLRQKREREGARRDVAADPTSGHDLADAVGAALRRLPRRERRIVELRHLNELSWDEVSRQLGTTPDAARKAGTRALASLRATLDRRGITATGTALLAGLRTLAAPSQSSAAVAVSAVTPPQLAQSVLTMLKLQSAAVTTAAVLATGGLVATAAALWQDDDPTPTRKVASAGLVATLDDGTTVELVALGDAEGNWWSPTGDPVTRPLELSDQHVAETMRRSDAKAWVVTRISNKELGLESVAVQAPAPVTTATRTTPDRDDLLLIHGLFSDWDEVVGDTHSLTLPLNTFKSLGDVEVSEAKTLFATEGFEVGVSRVLRDLRDSDSQPRVILSPGSDGMNFFFSVDVVLADGTRFPCFLHDWRGRYEIDPLEYRLSHLPTGSPAHLSVSYAPLQVANFSSFSKAAGESAEPTVEVISRASMNGPQWLSLPIGQNFHLEDTSYIDSLERLRELVDYEFTPIEESFAQSNINLESSITASFLPDTAIRDVLRIINELACGEGRSIDVLPRSRGVVLKAKRDLGD